VCYKRYMRKWMSERLKRRKKTGETPAEDGSKKQEPLQPRFYDDEPAAAEAAPAEMKRASRPETAAETADVVEPTPIPRDSAAGPRPRVQRRRRGRGGRGSSRTKKAGTLPSESALENSANVGSAKESGVVSTGEPSLTGDGGSAGIVAGGPAIAPVHSGSTHAKSVPAKATAVSAALGQNMASTPRPSKGTVVLAIGLPGSGKSSWFKRHNIHPLSSDLLRELLFDDPQEQRFQDLIFSNLRSMLKARLVARRPMNYVDATNLTPHDRHSWIKLAKDYGYDVQGVFFDVPLDVCMERHQRRGRVVPEDVMRKMAGKLRPPTFEEGFSKITVVRVKQKEKE
jgi:predicted kinase